MAGVTCLQKGISLFKLDTDIVASGAGQLSYTQTIRPVSRSTPTSAPCRWHISQEAPIRQYPH